MPTDTERLDWLESKSDGSRWIARQSYRGRGFRLHNTGADGSDYNLVRASARAAIDAAMEREKERP